MQYSMDAVVKREAPTFTVPDILSKVRQHLRGGRVIALEYRKYPGPPSVGPQGFQEMTPIPATIYLRKTADGHIKVETERSGFDTQEETFPYGDLDTRVVQWLKMPYFERVEYVDSTDYKVVIARLRQIYGIQEYQAPPPPVPQVSKAVVVPPSPDASASRNQWLLVTAVILFLLGLFTMYRG